VSERVKSRKVIIYDFDADGNERDTETSFEPVDESSSEFSGIVSTISLGHGVAPPDASGWFIYKVYEKVVIWLKRGVS
jgi:hypothetical protein